MATAPESPAPTSELRVFMGSAAWRTSSPGPVLTIGNFDGVHLGHRALVSAAVARARALGVEAVAYTFDPAPRDVLRPDSAIPRIQSLDARVSHLLAAGADRVVVEPFDRMMASMTPDAFARDLLGSRLRPSALVIGFDFRFGRGRAGGAADLADALGVPVETVPAVHHDGAPVSSSRVREAVRSGALAGAADLLGRPFSFVGTVIPGDARGRTLGFPTANVWPEPGGKAGATALLPPDGVYAVRVRVDGADLPGVMNLGTRPTFDGEARRAEVHLLDFAGDLYGQRVEVTPVAFLRPEQRFASVDALVAQVRADVAEARARLAASP
jgi:riboflavin kinase/FMN adenylyltransferase